MWQLLFAGFIQVIFVLLKLAGWKISWWYVFTPYYVLCIWFVISVMYYAIKGKLEI